MASSKTYKSIVLASRPKEDIIPGETFETKTQSVPKLSDLKDDEVILETLYLSLDPAMRGWMRGTQRPYNIQLRISCKLLLTHHFKDTRSYIPPVKIGEIMRGGTVGRVIASKSSKLPQGTLVTAMTGWTEIAIVHESKVQPLDLPRGGKPTDALGVLGGTGLTAYFGILDVGQVKPGDVVVVSGAAGATGSIVGQIAKVKGAKKVIGIVGSSDKMTWIKSIGFDAAVNYKSPNFAKEFKEATPERIDVFFDNVGGEVLDAALARAKEHARFVICGAISQYNVQNPQGPKNYLNVISMRIRMEGFIVFDYAKRYGDARKELGKWLEEGKIQRKETIVTGGIEKSVEALIGLYKGINTGKLLVEFKSPEERAKL